MRKSIASALTAAAAAAVVGGTGLAMASTHTAVSGTENFQMMTTSGTSSSASVIASGMFTAPGVDHEHNKANTATFVFSNGTINLKHSKGTGTQNFNPKTCLLTINEHGTYNLTSGTGAYTGITGSGKYQLSILAIGAKSGGKCTQSKPPVAFHQLINASGPVSLP
jgi:hypothetical protein